MRVPGSQTLTGHGDQLVWGRDAGTGRFSGVGKANAAGSHVFTLTAKNKVRTATQTFMITVS